jgi:plastocyanin
VTADQGSAFDVDIRGGGTATFTAPTAPGTYAYHCTYHPNMHGTLTVK